MYSKVNTMAILGIDGMSVSAEVDVSSGLPEFSLVGYLSSEVKEARERVKISLKNSGFRLEPRRITVNLAPADVRKEGTGFDLAIAVGILASYGLIPSDALKSAVFLGELGLDGHVCPVPGVLPMTLAAVERGFRACYVPDANREEAAVATGIRVIGVSTLETLVAFLNAEDETEALSASVPIETSGEEIYDVDFSEVNGQETMRRAAEVAAAGMHNLLMMGTPGSGKTMIARRIPTILPELTREESLEVTRVYSVCGQLPPGCSLMRTRPFRAPHHTVSAAALVGGGQRPRPGEISLAHRGVLFLDELPEFSRTALEALRQPLEDRMVMIARVTASYRFPADIMLCAAMNPCRCGYYPDRSRCRCSEEEVRRYMGRISRPLLDRMDICVEAPPVGYADMKANDRSESSAEIRERVKEAWERQRRRFQNSGIFFNSQMTGREVKHFCRMEADAEELMEQFFGQMKLSARAYHKVLKVARTIADLAGTEKICADQVSEALAYRHLDRKFWE